jgi:hypothetical protein
LSSSAVLPSIVVPDLPFVRLELVECCMEHRPGLFHHVLACPPALLDLPCEDVNVACTFLIDRVEHTQHHLEIGLLAFVQVFKIRNRSGYAAIYQNNLTEGRSSAEAMSRMLKAVARKPKKK